MEYLGLRQADVNIDESDTTVSVGTSAAQIIVSVSSVLAVQVVELETISTEFGMRCSEVISEIQELEAQSMLTGILDDRGKVRTPISYVCRGVTKHMSFAKSYIMIACFPVAD